MVSGDESGTTSRAGAVRRGEAPGDVVGEYVVGTIRGHPVERSFMIKWHSVGRPKIFSGVLNSEPVSD